MPGRPLYPQGMRPANGPRRSCVRRFHNSSSQGNEKRARTATHMLCWPIQTSSPAKFIICITEIPFLCYFDTQFLVLCFVDTKSLVLIQNPYFLHPAEHRYHCEPDGPGFIINQHVLIGNQDFLINKSGFIDRKSGFFH